MWHERPYGHSKILLLLPKEVKLLPTDYTPPVMDFEKKFKTIVPSRTDWKSEAPAKDYDIALYTDGSKMEPGDGAGVFSEELGIRESYRLPERCSVFQAEVMAIKQACLLLKQKTMASSIHKHVAIFIDKLP